MLYFPSRGFTSLSQPFHFQSLLRTVDIRICDPCTGTTCPSKLHPTWRHAERTKLAVRCRARLGVDPTPGVSTFKTDANSHQGGRAGWVLGPSALQVITTRSGHENGRQISSTFGHCTVRSLSSALALTVLSMCDPIPIVP